MGYFIPKAGQVSGPGVTRISERLADLLIPSGPRWDCPELGCDVHGIFLLLGFAEVTPPNEVTVTVVRSCNGMVTLS